MYGKDKIPPIIVARIKQIMMDDATRDMHEGRAKRSWEEPCTCNGVRYMVSMHNEEEFDVIIGVKKAQIQRP